MVQALEGRVTVASGPLQLQKVPLCWLIVGPIRPISLWEMPLGPFLGVKQAHLMEMILLTWGAMPS